MPAGKIQILFLAANPRDTDRLRLDEEVRSIDEALQGGEFRDKFNLETKWAVRVTDLEKHFLKYKPDIVHFSGHGSITSEIILEDDSGKSHSVSSRALSQLFAILKDNIKCVVLNACYSEQQAQAIAQHIDCVVGMSQAIGDPAAINFAAAFYQALAFGRNVKEAFDLGTTQIDLANLNEQDTPKLLCKNPEEIVIASGSKTTKKEPPIGGVQITEKVISALFEKCFQHKEDLEKCGLRVIDFLNKLLDKRSLTEAQKDEIKKFLVDLNQNIDKVRSYRKEIQKDKNLQTKEKKEDAERSLWVGFLDIKSMLTKYLEKEIVPKVESSPEGRQLSPTPPQIPAVTVVDEEIQIYLTAIKMKPDDDLAYNGMGNVYYQKGDYDKAIENYQKAIEINRSVSTYYSNLADASSRLKRWDTAISNYEKALSIKSTDDWALNGLANALMATGDYDKAIENYQKAIQINPHPTYYDNIADAYRNKKNWDTAVDFYKEALKLNEKDDWAYNGLGVCFAELKNNEEAIKNFDQAVKLNPKEITYYFNLGIAYDSSGEYDKATENFEQALKLNPEKYEIISRLGDAKLRKNQYEDAIKYYEKAISLSPEPNTIDYNGLGDAYRGLKKHDKALENYVNALKINRNDDWSLNGIGLVFLSQGKYQEAADKFNQAITINPNNFLYHSNLGCALTYLDKLDDAIQSFKKALQINPQNDMSYEGLGICYDAQGLFSKAIEQFESALNIKRLPRYYSHIGMSYQRQRNWEKAFQYLEKAVKLDPKDEIILSNLANAYNRRGLEHYDKMEDDKAIEYYKLALQMQPENDVFHWNLYLVYLARKDYAEAEQHLMMAIKLDPNNQKYIDNLKELTAKRGKA